MGQTALLDAFAQSDVDMRGYHILNCPDIRGPSTFTPISGYYLTGYNAATYTFSAAQLPPPILPPTINPTAHQWLNGWNRDSMSWSVAQVGYPDLLPPLAPVSFYNQRLVSVADPVGGQDAVNLDTVSEL